MMNEDGKSDGRILRGEVSERSQNIGFSRISQPGTPAQNLVQTRLGDETTVTENLHLAWESRP